MISEATYTTYLRDILKDTHSKELIDKALSTYPMYAPKNNPEYSLIPTREELNSKILNHYKYHQIGFETVGRFIDELEITMNEIMPYYYQLYKSADIINGLDDIFGNLDVTETFKEEKSGTRTDNTTGNMSGTNTSEVNSTATSESETTSDTSSTSRNVKSDTPQSKMNELGETIGDTGIFASEVAFNDDIASSTAANTGTDTTTSNTTANSSQESSTDSSGTTTGSTEHTLIRKGNQGVNTYAHDMLEFRDLILNIESQILNDKRLVELFMLVY